MSKTKYVGASIPTELVDEMQTIHERELAPLGIKFSTIAVLRFLMEFYKQNR